LLIAEFLSRDVEEVEAVVYEHACALEHVLAE
jgi:hypothetical protein